MPTLDTLESDIQQIREQIARFDASPLPEGARPLRQGEPMRGRDYWERLLAQREAELEAQQRAEWKKAEQDAAEKAKRKAAALAKAPDIEAAAREAARQAMENASAADALFVASPFGALVAAWDEYHRLHHEYELLRMDAP